MGDKISLNRAQIEFLTDWTELPDPEDAVEKFATLMIEEKVDPAHIVKCIDKIMRKIKNEKR